MLREIVENVDSYTGFVYFLVEIILDFCDIVFIIVDIYGIRIV